MIQLEGKITEGFAELANACKRRHDRKVGGYDPEGMRMTDLPAQNLINLIMAKIAAEESVVALRQRLAEHEALYPNQEAS